MLCGPVPTEAVHNRRIATRMLSHDAPEMTMTPNRCRSGYIYRQLGASRHRDDSVQNSSQARSPITDPRVLFFDPIRSVRSSPPFLVAHALTGRHIAS